MAHSYLLPVVLSRHVFKMLVFLQYVDICHRSVVSVIMMWHEWYIMHTFICAQPGHVN